MVLVAIPDMELKSKRGKGLLMGNIKKKTQMIPLYQIFGLRENLGNYP